jgi:DNA-binding IscR family transcriptional regulator
VNVVVTADARVLRRAVGVTAWAVLEELLLDASNDEHGAVMAATNVRRLAAHLGVSKDTAARALNRLARAGVVVRVVSGRGDGGALPTSSYVIDVAHVTGITVDLAPIAPNTTLRSRSPRPRTTSLDNAQASLFDLPATIS